MQPALFGWLTVSGSDEKSLLVYASGRLPRAVPPTRDLGAFQTPLDFPLMCLQYFPRLQAHHVDSVRPGGQDSGEQGRGRGVCDKEL